MMYWSNMTAYIVKFWNDVRRAFSMYSWGKRLAAFGGDEAKKTASVGTPNSVATDANDSTQGDQKPRRHPAKKDSVEPKASRPAKRQQKK
jgi:hypothetical protein